MLKRNAYGGRCKCGAFVPAGLGFLGPKSKGRFTVRCGICTPLTEPPATNLACDCDRPGCRGCDAVYDAIKDGEL